MAFFSGKEIGIDLGTSNILVAIKWNCFKWTISNSNR